MEPEGAQGAPQATKGPALTFIVEEEPPAGWRLVVTSRASLPVSAPQAGPTNSCFPSHGPGQPGTESTQQTSPAKGNFHSNICAQAESLVKRTTASALKALLPPRQRSRVEQHSGRWQEFQVYSGYVENRMWKCVCDLLLMTLLFAPNLLRHRGYGIAVRWKLKPSFMRYFPAQTGRAGCLALNIASELGPC